MRVMPPRNTARQQYTFNAIEIDLPFPSAKYHSAIVSSE